MTPLVAVHHDAAPHAVAVESQPELPRRRLLAWSAAAVALAVTAGSGERAAASAGRPPAGYELYRDTLDGYSFFYPSDWLQVKARRSTWRGVVDL